MDPGMALGLGLALGAAFLFNYSYMIQHGALDGGPEIDLRRPVATVRSLFSDRRWMLGLVVGAVGFVMHAVALGLAPLSIVQAFLASGLVFAVPMSVKMAGHKLTTRDTAGATLMTVALVLLAIGTGEHGSTNDFDPWSLGLYTAVTIALAVVASVAVRGERRAESLALAAGLLFGIADALINALVGLISGGIVALLASIWLWLCIATNLGAFAGWQKSLQVGRTKVLAIVVLMTAATKISAIGAGFVVFSDSLGETTAWKVIHVLCFVSIAIAGLMLAPAQAAITAAVELEPEDASAPGVGSR